MQAGVWNARVLLRELRERGYTGGYTLLTDWLRSQRQSTQTNAVRRFETPAGKQAQVDWGHLGTLEVDGQEWKLWGFTFSPIGECSIRQLDELLPHRWAAART